jgi:hypothetical protein
VFLQTYAVFLQSYLRLKSEATNPVDLASMLRGAAAKAAEAVEEK